VADDRVQGVDPFSGFNWVVVERLWHAGLLGSGSLRAYRTRFGRSDDSARRIDQGVGSGLTVLRRMPSLSISTSTTSPSFL
jgi:hypothetical protein